MKRLLSIGVIAFFTIIGLLTIIASISNFNVEKNDSISIMKRVDEKIYRLAVESIEKNSLSNLSAAKNRIRNIDQRLREDLDNVNNGRIVKLHDEFLLNVYRGIDQKIKAIKSGDTSNNMEAILGDLEELYMQIKDLEIQ